jgi:hypothetical protein
VGEIFPIANSRHQTNAEQMCQTKDDCVLCLGVASYFFWLDLGLVLEESI